MQFVGGEFDQFGVAERMPAPRRAQLGAYGAAAAVHPEQPPAAAQPVDGRAGFRGLPGGPGRVGDLAEQAVQERGRGVRVGGGVEVHLVHSVHCFHWLHSVRPVRRGIAGGDHRP